MEYLIRLLKGLRIQKKFKFHPKYAKVNLIYLGFADDFCFEKIFNCYSIFSMASGLQANANKSSVYFGGVPGNIQYQILEVLGFTISTMPFRYLGVPLSTKRISITQC